MSRRSPSQRPHGPLAWQAHATGAAKRLFFRATNSSELQPMVARSTPLFTGIWRALEHGAPEGHRRQVLHRPLMGWWATSVLGALLATRQFEKAQRVLDLAGPVWSGRADPAWRTRELQIRCQRGQFSEAEALVDGWGGWSTLTQHASPAAAGLLATRQRWSDLIAFLADRLDRDMDMIITGKRHPFYSRFRVGYDGRGMLLGAEVDLYSDGGWSLDLSQPVLDRALFHIDNAYYLEHVEITSHRCKTHTVSNTAFRGFGGPQGMMVIEAVLDDIARTLNLDPLGVRRVNLYGGAGRKVTH